MSKRALIYARVSKDATGEGDSVARQIDACEKVAAQRGWTVVGREVDNSISASNGAARPAWERVLAAMKNREVEVVIAWQLDRITRSMGDLERLIKVADESRVPIVTAAGDLDLTTDGGQLLARVLGAFAHAEVQRKGSRQRLANEQRASRGLPHSGGRKIFGYDQAGLEIVPVEAEAIRDGARRILSGMSVRSVATDWNERGLRSAIALTKGGTRNAQWSATGVSRLMQNPRLAGLLIRKGEEQGQGAWPAILTLETHLALKAILGDPGRRSRTSGGRTPTTLLTRIALCDRCREHVVGASSPHVVDGVREQRMDYTCSGPRRCFYAPRDLIDAHVEGLLIGRLSGADAWQALTAAPSDEVQQDLHRQLAHHTERLATARESWLAGRLSQRDYDDLTERANRDIDSIRRELTDTTRAVAAALGSDDVAAHWDALEIAEKRALISEVFDYVRIRSLGKVRSYDPALSVVTRLAGAARDVPDAAP